MSTERPVQELMGSPGSPYTRKMLSLMRFRNIPYRFERQAMPGTEDAHVKTRPKAKVPLLPTFYYKDETGDDIAVTDSSPLIRRFEKEYSGRSVIPADPALAFIDMLLEDYADEWLTKPMFHYRWHYQADIKKAGDILPRGYAICAPDEQIAGLSQMFSERQVSRLSYVGSNEVTKPVIEESFKHFIHLLNKHLEQQPFLLGERPGSADFAVYGQLTCLALFDPTPQAIILAEVPRVYAWAESMDDMSGYRVSEHDWTDLEQITPTLKNILSEVGRIYVPYLLGNAKAVMEKSAEVDMTLAGERWQQNPFPYQAKCLRWLREAYATLSEVDRARLDAVLSDTGVLALFD